jgi:hypothetical protein
MSKNSTTFQKGRSGNPGGRPKLPEELRDRIRALSDDAVTVLEHALRDEDVRVRLVAAQTLLDRGYGRPAQAKDVTLTTKQDASNAHLQALLEVARLRRAVPIDLNDGLAQDA